MKGLLTITPTLMQHYQEDHYRNHRIGLIKFLVMHYCTDDGTSADDNEDNQLPFKQPHGAGFFLAEVPANTTFAGGNKEFDAPEPTASFPKFFIKNIYLHIPLQPPRLMMT